MKQRNLTKRYHVKAFVPKPEILAIASERTEGLISAFIFAGGSRYDKLVDFARSCYLQGLHDGIDAAVKNGWMPNSKEPA